MRRIRKGAGVASGFAADGSVASKNPVSEEGAAQGPARFARWRHGGNVVIFGLAEQRRQHLPSTSVVR